MIFCACSNMLVSCVLQPSELAKALAARAAKITKSKFALMDMLIKSNRKDARSQARMATKNRGIKLFPMLFGSVGDKMDLFKFCGLYARVFIQQILAST